MGIAAKAAVLEVTVESPAVLLEIVQQLRLEAQAAPLALSKTLSHRCLQHLDHSILGFGAKEVSSGCTYKDSKFGKLSSSSN